MLNLLLAFLELGVPMALLSWLLFMRFLAEASLIGRLTAERLTRV